MNIHFISPYSITKDIGGCINEAIAQLSAPDEDWIVHADMDVLWLRPDSKAQLIQILNTTDYNILSTTTNRLAMPHQLVDGMFNEFDIREHVKVADKMSDLNYGLVIPTHEVLAAFCLCFTVKTWREMGGFIPKSLQFDSMFSILANRKGYKLGIMSGIYLFHSYRIMSDRPAADIKHLM